MMLFKKQLALIKFSASLSTALISSQIIEPSGRVFVKNRNRNFIDQLRITVSGGTGGNGYPKYEGLGGNGGNVCLVAKSNVKLKDLKRSNQRFSANNGQHSSRSAIIGRNGKDLQINVPVGITVILDEYRKEIAHLDKPGDKVIVAFGGRGGDKMNNYCGSKGQKLVIKLDLKLLADVGLIGYPNAGKSTLLRALSRASPKIANYPFTTIKPNLGVIEYDPPKTIQKLLNDNKQIDSDNNNKYYSQDYRRITVADLPGLIDGAHRNIGLGHKFMKHIERTNLLLFVIDIDGFRNVGGIHYHPEWHSNEPINVIQSLINEIDLYDETILEKRSSILVISKLDTTEKRNKFDNFIEILQKTNLKIPSRNNRDDDCIINDNNDNDIIDHNGTFVLDHHPPSSSSSSNYRFDKIIGISSVTGFNIDQLKGLIRKLIDDYAEKQLQLQQSQSSN